MFIYIVCPSRIKKYFWHIIQSFFYELSNSSLKVQIITDIQTILSIKNSKIILFGLQEFCKYHSFTSFMISNHVYVYNTEQLQSGNWDYMFTNITNLIKEWWDYSQNNINYIIKKTKENPSFKCLTRFVPFGYSQILDLNIKTFDNKTDITFFGTHHDRRANFCNKLYNMIKKFNKKVRYITSDDLYDKTYDQFITNNSIFLNIHYYIPSILEVIRIIPLISQGHLVFTERSDDPVLDEMLEPFVEFIEEDKLEDDKYIENLVRKINSHDFLSLKSKVIVELSFRDFLEQSGVFEVLSKD